jgi:hypothetical protein
MSIFHIGKITSRVGFGQTAPGYILRPGKQVQPANQNFIRAERRDPTVRPSSPGLVKSETTSNKTGTQTINLLNNYDSWAQTPVLNNIYNSLIKLPFIHLKEYRLDGSTLWVQFLYFTFYRFYARPAEAVEDVFGSGTWVERTLRSVQESVESLPDNTLFSTVNRFAERFTGLKLPDLRVATLKDPYEGLYDLTSTGFDYIFPFFEKDIFRKGSMYSDTYSGESQKQFVMEDLQIIENMTLNHSQGLRAFAEPGLYIEKSQFYEFGENLEEIKFSFPLLNTQSQEQINQNFQLIFLLVFQNSMYRKDRAAFIPPCIYEVLIPGIRYMRYAHISNLEVNFLGVRRMTTVQTPSIAGLINVKTIIPEAYNITITIRGLHEETANFMYRSGSNTFGDVQYLADQEGQFRQPLS